MDYSIFYFNAYSDHAVAYYSHLDNHGVIMTFAIICVLATLSFLFIHEELTVFIVLLIILGQIML